MYVSVPFRHERTLGRGLGGILSNLKHLVKPIFHKTKDIFVKPLAKEGLNFLASTTKGILEGEKPSEALKKNFEKSKRKVKKKGKKILSELVTPKKKNKGKKKKSVKKTGKGKKKSGPKKKKNQFLPKKVQKRKNLSLTITFR